MNPFTAACVQMTSSGDVDENISSASALIREAHSQGATFILTPEMTNIIDQSSGLWGKISPAEECPSVAAFEALAAELNIWLLIGSLAVKVGERKAANRSFLFNPDGHIAAQYDKAHMFDVDLSGGESYRESRTYEAGRDMVTADLPWGRLGLSICYDLRFPALYRALAKAGADFLTVPSAFTRQTGEAHWHILNRARAIETGCFVIAPAQTGRHWNGRETYGHSLIIDPWGKVLADGGTDIGIVLAEIDPAEVAKARGRIPSLSHDREYQLPN